MLKILVLIYSSVAFFFNIQSVFTKEKTNKEEKKKQPNKQNTNSGILFAFYSLQLEQSMCSGKKRYSHH